jgi:type VI secretion system secreted protein VgrG
MDVIWEKPDPLPFDQLLGQKVSVELTTNPGHKRYFSGIVSRVTQGDRSLELFTNYTLEVVPSLWLLTRKTQSRIFQHKNIPDILKAVLQGLDTSYEIQGTFEEREYCVQYRETDFAFASRLMEEEGIYYFFKHTGGGHQMVLANAPQSHPKVAFPDAASVLGWEGVVAPDDRVTEWSKAQEIRSGKVTLWDHTFEMPDKHLEADKVIQASVAVGKTTHKLGLPVSSQLEQYDFPGAYAQRFDGVDKGGGEQPAKLQKIFDDNKRTVGIRMQQEAVDGVWIEGKSVIPVFAPGYKFDLKDHFSDDGSYVLKTVVHRINQPLTVEQDQKPFEYDNSFECMPLALPYRPPMVTPEPYIRGVQTATVVGPSGEEIFTDKYGRVKVQFHWDREGKNDANSSCWCRVATFWAGKQWGAIHIPRIGQEVIVDFLEGDVDHPIIVGSVYNAEQMPPYTLPDNKTQSGIKTRSSLRGTPANFNEIRFEDKKGSEQLFIHAEKNQDIEVENDETHWVGHDRTKTIDHDETHHVKHDRTRTVDNNEKITITQGNRDMQIKMGNQSYKLDMGNIDTKLSMGNMTTKMDLGKSETEAMQSIELKVGQSSVKLDQMGVTIKGMMISIEGQIQVSVKGVMTQITGSAMLQEQGGIIMIN